MRTLPGFNGAGLYDSKTQHAEETAEDGISKSLKQVFASLWNFRAFIERDFHRIDHMKTAMGVLVHPNYTDELVNGVAVSADPAYGTEDTYYVNAQLGEDLVTNPEVHSVPEEVLMFSSGDYSVVALSNLVLPGQILMTSEQIEQLRSHLVTIHERFSELYEVDDDDQFAVEIEFKITSQNTLAIKQARPWIFTDTPDFDVERNTQADDPLTGEFQLAPRTHTGKATLSVWALFSESISIGFQEFRDEALKVTGGSVVKAGRHENREDYWSIRVKPDGPADLTISLTPNLPCGAMGAICTFDGRRLSNAITHTVIGQLPRTPDRPTGEKYLDGTASLSWNDVDRAGSYQMEMLRSGQWESLPSEDVTVAFNKNSAVVSGLEDGETYKFRVRGVNSHGTSDWSAALELSSTLDWEAEFVPRRVPNVAPLEIGYSFYRNPDEPLSPDYFTLDGKSYAIRFLAYTMEGLWFGINPELPADFSLMIDGSVFRASDSAVPPTGPRVGGYWWPVEPPDWVEKESIDIGIRVHRTLSTGSREKAPVSGKFRNFPETHNGNDDISFRIHFSEGVPTAVDAMRNHVLAVSGANVADVLDVGGDGRIWEVSLSPESLEPITIAIERDRDCALPDAVCTADGRGLHNRMKLSIDVMEHSRATGAPEILGTVDVGETLSVDTTNISDDDGMTGTVFRYQWITDDGSVAEEVSGADGPTYTVMPSDDGHAFRVRVTFEDDAGFKEALTSPTVYAKRPYALSVTRIDDSFRLKWKLPFGNSEITMFRILRHRPELNEPESTIYVEFTGDRSKTFTDTSLEPGVLYVYRVQAVDYFGETSEPSEPASARFSSANHPATGEPQIIGNAHVGETLSVDTSPIADPDGMGSVAFRYQWFADDTEIAGATSASYTVADADEGKTITAQVSFIDDAGNRESLTSAATPHVTPPLTAEFLDTPSSHNGEDVFTFELRFSEEFSVSYRTLIEHAFNITGGHVS